MPGTFSSVFLASILSLEFFSPLPYNYRMGMKEKNERIKKLIARWVIEVEANNAENFFDINKVGEDIAQLLLNKVYNLNLQNLNDVQKNFPAVDLGDDQNGIAFQVTSRYDAAKIRDSLEKFASYQLSEQFPNGLRFFLLTFKKEKAWSYKQKQKFAGIVNGFDADTDIINCTDLTGQIKKIYREDSERFTAVADLLEREFSDVEKSAGQAKILPTSMEFDAIMRLIKATKDDYEKFIFKTWFDLNDNERKPNACEISGRDAVGKFLRIFHKILKNNVTSSHGHPLKEGSLRNIFADGILENFDSLESLLKKIIRAIEHIKNSEPYKNKDTGCLYNYDEFKHYINENLIINKEIFYEIKGSLLPKALELCERKRERIPGELSKSVERINEIGIYFDKISQYLRQEGDRQLP